MITFIMDSYRQTLEGIARYLEVPGIDKKLGGLALNKLQTLMVKVMAEQSELRTPNSLMNDYWGKSEFFGSSEIPQDSLYRFGSICFESMPDTFKHVQLSPIAPLGLNSILTNVSQNNTLTTIRSSEVVSDPTTQLALECAHRYNDSEEEIVNLSTLGRVVRLQAFDKGKGYMQHFNLLGLCSGAKNRPKLEVNMISDHISAILDIVRGLNSNGYSINNISVNLSNILVLDEIMEAYNIPETQVIRNSLNDEFDLFEQYNVDFPKLIFDPDEITPDIFLDKHLNDSSMYFKRMFEGILAPLQERYPEITACLDFNRKAGRGYYQDLCFHIFGETDAGQRVQLADGGTVDWLAELRNNKKLKMVTSGFGAELIQKLFVNRES